MDRRHLLGLAGLSSASLLTACSVDGGWDDGQLDSATCVTRAELDPHTALGSLPLVYEVNQSRSRFFFEPGFFAQLESWLDFVTASPGLEGLAQIRTYGSWTDRGSSCDSWHHSGRAFDLASLRSRDATLVSCRYDQWRDAPEGELASARRAYWRLAASLHLHFAYVLTYLYDDTHLNHIHVDNGRSGSGLSQLRTRSRVQVQAVQAICSYVWDEPVEITDRWDGATAQAARRVLERIGIRGELDDSTENWHAFLRASVGPVA